VTTRRSHPYHHGDLREALLDAAEGILAPAGAHELSLREITRRVGVTHTAAYHHFEDREALVRALAARGFDRLSAALAGAAAASPGPDAFLEVGIAYVAFAARNPGLFRLMFGSEAAAGRGSDAALRSSGDRALAILKEGARSAVPDGTEADVLGVALRSWSAVHGLASLILDDQLAHLGLALRDHERIARAVLSGAPLAPQASEGGP
jgi:AcrR family transcriptional regulator